MSEAGIEVPEFRCPTPPATLASTSFCATVVPTFGSAWSSSATSVNFTSLPSILMPAAFASSMARRAPFSLSLPRCAMPPVSGATWPILTSVPPACAAGVAAPLSAAGLGASLLQPASAMPAASSESASFLLIIDSSEVGKACRRISYLRPSSEIDRAGRRVRLLLRQDPLHQRVDVVIGHLRVRRHWHLTPDSLTALLHFLEQLCLGLFVVAIFRRHVLVRRTDELLVDGVAGKAVVLLGELFLRVGGHCGGQCSGK